MPSTETSALSASVGDGVLPRVTILVPMRNEEADIAHCLASLRAQDYPLLEILVLDGESTDRSAEIVATIAREDSRIRLALNPGRTQAVAMNLGLSLATGEIIVRADAHAHYGPDYISRCVAHLRQGRAENVGGLQRAEGATSFTRALAAAMASPLGAGNAAYRVATAPKYTDTVWLGAWRKATLEAIGGFDESLPANEDYELNYRLRASGGRVLLDPALPGVYYPRSSPARLWRQYLCYGRGKVAMLRKHPHSLRLRQVAAPVLVGAGILALALLPLSVWPLAVWGGGYALLLLLGTGTAKAHWRDAGFLPLIFVIIHFAWGLGFLAELCAGRRH